MYKIYKTSRGKLSSPAKPSPGCWIDITSPTAEELEELKPFFEIPEEVLRSVKDVDEVPKVEDEEDFQFIVIQTPLDNEGSEVGEYAVRPLGILYNKDYVITISDGKNDVMNYLRVKLKNFDLNKIISSDKKQQLILKLILFASKIYLRYLKVINHGIIVAQNDIERSSQNKDIIRLMDIGKSLAYFNRSLHSNFIVVEKLAKRKLFNGTEEDEELIEDVMDETKQGIETVKIYERIVIDTANTFATIISNNLNQSVKFLTSITIILMLPTFVASIYGMNVDLPYQHGEHGFSIVMSMILFSTIIGIVVFLKKRLF